MIYLVNLLNLFAKFTYHLANIEKIEQIYYTDKQKNKQKGKVEKEMSVTAKQIAKQLNLSESAVSLALNQKPGVSTKTRKRVIEAAKSLNFDFNKINPVNKQAGIISFILYNKNLIFDLPFFKELKSGVENEFKNTGYKLSIYHIHDIEDVQEQINEILSLGCDGIILLGTEMSREDFAPFSFIDVPIILLDSFFNSSKMDCILINNVEGARVATNYLIKKRHAQPGYLQSSYRISNFDERADGFYKAIRQNGMSVFKSIVHSLGPSIDAAYADMIAVVEQREELATCYFADNDEIAIGAMKALKEKGYRIPTDIAIIGFDNIPFSSFVEPSLTTVNVPKEYLGRLAAKRMLSILKEPEYHPIKLEVNTNLIIRNSIT